MSAAQSVPAYYAASKHAIDAIDLIKKSFDIPAASKKMQEAYKIALGIIKSRFVDGQESDGIPLSVVLYVLDAISLEKVQCENGFKFEAAKTMRIFLDLSLITTHSSEQNIYPASQKKIIETVYAILKTVPKDEVRTEYELKCCAASALLLNDVTMDVTTFISDSIEDVIKGILDLSPGELTKPVVESVKKAYRLFTISWFDKVFPLHLRSRTLFQASGGVNASLLPHYCRDNAKELKDFNKTREVAFCVLEDLIMMMEKAAEVKNIELQEELLNAKSLNTLCIRQFLDPKEIHWRVHYRAIYFLFEVAKGSDVEKIWQSALTLILGRAKPDKTKLVVEKMVLKNIKAIKVNRSFSKQLTYLKDILRGKQDKSKWDALIVDTGKKMEAIAKKKEEPAKALKKKTEIAPEQQAGGDETGPTEGELRESLKSLNKEAKQAAAELTYFKVEQMLAEL